MRLPIWRRVEIDAANRAKPEVVPPVPELTATIREVLGAIRKAGPIGIPGNRLYSALKTTRGLTMAQFLLLMSALTTGGHVKQVDWQFYLAGVQS